MHYAIAIAFLIRRRHHGKLIVFSERVKSKSFPTFVIHATPLHGGLDDQSTNAEEKDKEKLEMKTFGKTYKGIYYCASKSQNELHYLVLFKGAVVLIPNFDAHVKRMHEDRDKLFEDEYLVSH